MLFGVRRERRQCLFTRYYQRNFWRFARLSLRHTLLVATILRHITVRYIFLSTIQLLCGLGSSVSIATELRARRSGDRIPVGRDFPPVQTGPGTHTASCTMGTGSFPRVKYGWGVLLTTHPLLVPRSWKSRAIPLPILWATTGPVTGSLYLFFTIQLLKKEQVITVPNITL